VRHRSFIFVALLVGVLVVAGLAVYLYDASREDQIAEGVTVGGVAVGGMTTDAARAKVQRIMGVKLRDPVLVKYKKRTFELTPRQAGLIVNTQAMVDEALERSREGSIFSRTYREVRGESLNVALPADVDYDQAAVRRFVKRIENKLDRKPKDASLSLDGGVPEPVPGRKGIAIEGTQLQASVEQALKNGSGTNTVDVRARETRPKVTMADLAKKYPTLIVINRGGFQLTLYKDLKQVKTYGIAIGAVGYDTPAGMYEVTDKAVDPNWYVPEADWAGDLAGTVVPGGAANNPLKARWMGFYNGAGIHGTAERGSIGSAASHGCIRMLEEDVIELYDQVPVHSPLYIA
jgi:lipoprotein-anchoring transpeptidase ErfK/SrfK